jgi:tetratricopeptide (TPR) repeat protein
VCLPQRANGGLAGDPAAASQQTPKPALSAVEGVTLETSQTLFSVLAAVNACGYNQELGSSYAVRSKIRAELARAAEASPEAAGARDQLCQFYRDHRQADAGRDLAQYISLALNLGDPPKFVTLVTDADLPPDAAYVRGLVPLLQTYYEQEKLRAFWQTHQAEYEQLVEQFHDPVSKMILATEVYLKLPMSTYVGRKFTLLLEPLGAPGQVNARNYASDYFIVVAPENGKLRMGEIRHAYLHYVLDPFALKRANALKRLEPLLVAVQQAPMDDSYKRDVSLLVTESLIRAIEARTLRDGKAPEAQRREFVQSSVEEGFILTQHFYEQLAQFEKTPDSLRNAYPDFLLAIDIDREKKRARALSFRPQATPDVLHAGKAKPVDALEVAEERLASGDLSGARQLADAALASPQQNQARALFILARAATLSRDMQGARAYFERTLEVAREPRMVAWSHIYLARILDLQESREEALKHYRAALAAGDDKPDTKTAAERGLQQPYEPPAAARPGTSQPPSGKQEE